MRKTYFVTGTCTEVGKTTISEALLFAASQRNLKTLALKPIAAGCEPHDQYGQVNEDAERLMNQASIALPYSQVNPVALVEPIAPHIAAAREGKRLTLNHLEGICRGALATPSDFRLIEGAGGWRVPINARESLSALPKNLDIPVILVVGLRLGCLNHALLSAETIVRDGVRIAAWVANSLSNSMDAEEENVQTLAKRLPFPFLGHVPFLESPTVESVAENLNLDLIL